MTAARPGYPPALIDDLVTFAGDERRRARDRSRDRQGDAAGRRPRRLGARDRAERGDGGVARAATESLDGVEYVIADFERWRPQGRTFPLVYAAQAWHWVDQERGYAHARAALSPGGHLVAFWNRPAWGDSALRRALSDAYRRTVPQLPPDGPMHPDNHAPHGGDAWERAVAATDGLTEPGRRCYAWSIDYTATEYVELLSTMSEVRLLIEPARAALLEAVGETIERHGARLTMPMATDASIARAE